MAVYTRLSQEHFSSLLGRYGLGTLVEAREIAEGVENSNYILITKHNNEAKQRHILTLFEKRVDAQDLPFFLGITEHLAAQGIPCPRPLYTDTKELFTEIAGKKAAIVTFLEGKSLKRPEPAHLLELGAILGRMHQAAEGFTLTRANDLSLNGWASLLGSIEARADEITPGLTEALTAEFVYLEQHWPKNLPKGVIHADLFPDNVFFTGDRLTGVIDFYFSCNDFYIYDLVITMNAWCFERDGSFNLTKARALLTAYNRIRTLSTAEYEALPVLARGAALRFLLTRAHDWLHHDAQALVRPHDPLEYLRKLRFHQQVKQACEYGL